MCGTPSSIVVRLASASRFKTEWMRYFAPPHLIVFVGSVRNVRNTPPNADVFARLVGNVRPKPAKRSYGCGQIRSSGNWPVTT